MQPSPTVPELVGRWVAAGIINEEQAQRIRADLATLPPQQSRGSSLVAEALGYLGGVIVLVGLSFVIGWFWEDLTSEARAGVAGAIAVALVAAGAFVPGRPGATARLRGVLWLAGSAATFACLALVADDLIGWENERVVLTAAGGTTLLAAVLWAVHRHVLQQLMVVGSLLLTAWSGTMLATESDMWSSLAVWGVGVVWFVMSLPGIVPASGGVLGAIGSVLGGLMMIGDEAEWGPLFALATVVALVVTAVARRDLGVLGVGSVGTLIALPFAVEEYFPGELQAALSLVVAGLALVATGVYVARRRRTTPTS
jgi:hypothetical protein